MCEIQRAVTFSKTKAYRGHCSVEDMRAISQDILEGFLPLNRISTNTLQGNSIFLVYCFSSNYLKTCTITSVRSYTHFLLHHMINTCLSLVPCKRLSIFDLGFLFIVETNSDHDFSSPCRGTWVAQSVEHQTLDFGSGHDLSTLNVEPAQDSVSLPLPRLCSLSK